MQTITIEKVIKFDNVIDSIDNVVVNNDLKYDLLDGNSHIKGTIKLSGCVNTILGQKEFNEDVDVDIYTPDDQKLDENNFKMTIKDYSYMVNQQNLIVYIVLNLDGLVTNDESSLKNSDEIIEDINNLNEINEESLDNINDNDIREEMTLANIKESEKIDCKVNIKDNNENEKISTNWAKDLFKLSDNYTTFMKIHLD